MTEQNDTGDYRKLSEKSEGIEGKRRDGRGQWYIEKARKRFFSLPGYQETGCPILVVNPNLSEGIGKGQESGVKTKDVTDR